MFLNTFFYICRFLFVTFVFFPYLCRLFFMTPEYQNLYYLDKFTQTPVVVYIIALLVVSFMFSEYAMHWYWWLFGIVGVFGFFYGINYYTRTWLGFGVRRFEKSLFSTALVIRVIAVFFLYWFFDTMTGRPFMFQAADAFEYGEEAKWMADCIREGRFSVYWDYKFVLSNGVSDAGYPMYLGFVYWLTGDSIIAARLLKALWSSFTCVLLYRLGSRNFGEHVGRMAGVFLMLEPHFIIYSGMHLKETEMIFMLVLFLERADNLLRSREFRFWDVAPVFLLALSLFTFRTVLGATAVGAMAMALVLSSKRVANLGRRWFLLIVFLAGSSLFLGGRIASEIDRYWNLRDSNQSNRMTEIKRTQSFAQYATKGVLAPMIFTIPFPTMVETPNQENHRLQHAGYVAKNIMSFFCILAIVLLLINQDPDTGWRNNILIGAFLIAYLLVLVQSAFIHADRFHLPAYVIELLFAAYGVARCTRLRFRRWFTYWNVLMLVAWVVWAWFKLAGRGMIE